MSEAGVYQKRGEELLDLLIAAISDLESSGEGMTDYRSYLHGQIYGMATALKLIYPGPGNLGEKAALALRPVITEQSCQCEEGPEK